MRIMSKRHSATFSTERERESCPHSSLSESVLLPTGMLAAELNWTEKGTNQSMKWSRSLCSLKRFVHLNDTFPTNTTLEARWGNGGGGTEEKTLTDRGRQTATRGIHKRHLKDTRLHGKSKHKTQQDTTQRHGNSSNHKLLWGISHLLSILY